MNDVINAIMGRYSCRDFSPAPISAEQLDILVKAALASPSAVNRQPWHIIAITDKALLDEMDGYILESIKQENPDWYNRMLERGGKIFYDAPCLILIARDDSDYAALDSGIVSQNVAIAAHAMGLGNVICGMARSAFSGPRGDEFKKRANIPDNYVFGISVCVGAAQSGKEPHELDMEKVTYVGNLREPS